MLIDKIREAQQGDRDAMLYLIQKYTPLLKGYSKKMYQEDAFSELTLAFIELIHHIKIQKLTCTADGAITNYIVASVKNIYIACIKDIMREKGRITAWEDFSEQDEYRLSVEFSSSSPDFAFRDFLNEFSCLTEKERQVLLQIYLYGYSAAEIASQLKTSRQNINQIKTRAQNKIKAVLQK